VESPLAVTACNCLLSIFPPFNLLVLTLLIAMQRRCPPSAFAVTREPGPPPGRNDAPRPHGRCSASPPARVAVPACRTKR
jgi:hypothetical protein